MKKIFTLLFVLFAVSITASYAQSGLYFDGTDDSVVTTMPGITGNTARTIEAWIKVPSTASTVQKAIVDMGAGAPNGSRFTLNVINGQNLRVEVAGNGFNAPAVDITDDNWHHVAVTYNPANATGQKAKLYVDGVYQTQADFTVTPNTTSGSVRIGIRVDGASPFIGVIDEVRIWNVERTAAQLLANKGTEFCTIPTGLIGYYKFNNGVAGGNKYRHYNNP
jgi:hypothetical protein